MSVPASDRGAPAPPRPRAYHRHRPPAAPVSPPSSVAAPTAPAVDAEVDDRTVRQRLSDALPMASVAGICFALGLSLRAGGASGPAPALPIWTLFLALGCIAALGAGASWVAGGSSATAPDPSRRFGHRTRQPALRERTDPAAGLGAGSGGADVPLGDPMDDALPAQRWAREVPLMAGAPHRRAAATPPPNDRPEEIGRAGPVEPTPAYQMLEELDRLATDLKPAGPRGRAAT